jgi:ABC-type nitrate/sulfonate/bicarbonate transport system substrate-binding protein
MPRTTLTKTLATVAIALLGTASLAACSGSNAKDATTASGDYKIVFTSGSALVTDWDVYIAEKEGFFTKHHVKVDDVSTETAEAANKLLVTGEAQVGRGLAPMIQSMQSSGGSLDLVDVGDALVRPPFYLNVKQSVTDPSQLKGLKIGVSSDTDNTTIVTLDMLNRLDISEKDVDLVTAGGTSARFAGLQSGAIDASLLFPPVAQTAVKAGFPSLGYVPQLMGDDYKYAFTSVIMNRAWVKKNPDAAKAYLAARNDALKFLADPANKADAIDILAKATNVDTAAATDTYETLKIGTPQSAFSPKIGIDKDADNGTIKILKRAGQAPADLKLDDIVDPSIAKSVN